ncbi:MAG: DUF4384 domain-containing protein [Elusimicrobia bacterium]|nr:DUF4384 domain-containing protein [Elusimicrobiota bacterium]
MKITSFSLAAAALCLALAAVVPPAAFARAKDIEKAANRLARDLRDGTSIKSLSVAVLPFTDAEDRADELGAVLSDFLIAGLQKDRRFTFLDRKYLSAVVKEARLGQIGIGDPSTAVELGKITGATYLLLGQTHPAGKGELIVDVTLKETQSSQIIAFAHETIDFDEETRALYERLAHVDKVNAAVGDAAEGRSGDVVALNQLGKDGSRWVEVRAGVPMKGMSRAEARAAAVTRARRKALRHVAPGSASSDADFGDEAILGRIEQALKAARSGRVEEEKFVEDGPAGSSYRVVLQTCLRPLRENADADFSAQLLLSQNRFVEGQEAKTFVTATKDAHFYLYSVDFDGQAGRVYPVPESHDNQVGPEKPVAFPSDAQRAAGIRLVAELPKGADSSFETLRVLVVKHDVDRRLEGAKTYPDILKRLDDAGEDWAEDVRVFSIYKKP